MQGPLGWKSLSGLPRGEPVLRMDVDFLVNADEYAEISAMTWEAAIQKHVEEEFYASSPEVSLSSPSLKHIHIHMLPQPTLF